MKGAQRYARVGVFGGQGDGLFQRLLHLAAQALRQRLGHADALTVASQRVGVPIPGVGVVRFCGGLGLGPFGHLHEQVQSRLFFGLQVVGIDGCGLVGHRDACPTCGQAGCCSLLELTAVEQRPRSQHGGVLGAGFCITAMQSRPMLLDARGVERVVACVREGGPFGHGVCLRKFWWWGVSVVGCLCVSLALRRRRRPAPAGGRAGRFRGTA